MNILPISGSEIVVRKLPFMTAAVLLAAAMLASGCQQPPQTSYSRDIQPLLKSHCQDCHVPGKPGFESSGLDVSTHAALMKGGKYGPLVMPGNALASTLNALVEGRAHPSLRMPHGRGKLNDEDIKKLKDWVDQGAKNN